MKEGVDGMKLIIKYLAKDILSCLTILGVLKCLNLEQFNVVSGVVIAGFVIQFIFSMILSVKPIVSLYYSLYKIDFSEVSDKPIDFSRFDKLHIKKSTEIGVIKSKLGHLIDTLCTRITSLDSEVYKATHDALSGCYNIQYWKEHSPYYSSCDSICIVFLDVNNLKRMNDTVGHEAGDNLIKTAASKLRYWEDNNLGDVYRVGGDEFLVAIPNKSAEECKSLADAWYSKTGRMNREEDGFACVFSMGIAYGEKGCDVDALKKKADNRMYECKKKIKEMLGEPMR